MKRKEILSLAKKIAKYQRILDTSTDLKEKQMAETEIVKLSSSIKSLQDMVELDDAIQDFLEKEKI